jgi:hypothetical protein
MGRLGLDETVLALLTATSSAVGQPFFEALAQTTAQCLGVRWALVGQLLPGNTRVQTLAVWDTDRLLPSFTYPLPGTPCANVAEEGACQYLAGVTESFPEDLLLAQMGAQSYAGIA